MLPLLTNSRRSRPLPSSSHPRTRIFISMLLHLHMSRLATHDSRLPSFLPSPNIYRTPYTPIAPRPSTLLALHIALPVRLFSWLSLFCLPHYLFPFITLGHAQHTWNPTSLFSGTQTCNYFTSMDLIYFYRTYILAYSMHTYMYYRLFIHYSYLHATTTTRRSCAGTGKPSSQVPAHHLLYPSPPCPSPPIARLLSRPTQTKTANAHGNRK
ncbi:hypothetical protein C8R46DRAFT_1080544 [Mycena filopes]|nr:hypothetical protein C8R46DRAFT_1080544 [Mycena filopes]